VVTTMASTCNGSLNDALSSYFAEAHPNQLGSSGQRSFGTDQRGTVFQNPTGTAFTAALVASSTNPIQ